MRKCSKCSVEKENSEFYFRKKDGISRTCKLCESVYKKQWRIDHKEHVQEYNKKYDKVNRPDRIKLYRESHPGWAYEQTKKQRDKNPLAHRELEAMRRARKHGSPIVERVYYQEIYDRDKGICQLQIHPDCPINLDPNPLFWEIDHTIPLARQGDHSYLNVRLCCSLCNDRKHY